MNGSMAQNNAVIVESLIKQEFNCERFQFGGIANSDTIRRSGGFWYSMAVIFAKYFCHLSKIEKDEINNFLNDNYYLSDKSLDDIKEDEFEKILNEFQCILKRIKN